MGIGRCETGEIRTMEITMSDLGRDFLPSEGERLFLIESYTWTTPEAGLGLDHTTKET